MPSSYCWIKSRISIAPKNPPCALGGRGNCTNLENQSELTSTQHRTVATLCPATVHTRSTLVIACSINFNAIETDFVWEYLILPAASFSSANHTVNLSCRICICSVPKQSPTSWAISFCFLCVDMVNERKSHSVFKIWLLL